MRQVLLSRMAVAVRIVLILCYGGALKVCVHRHDNLDDSLWKLIDFISQRVTSVLHNAPGITLPRDVGDPTGPRLEGLESVVPGIERTRIW